ncbi:MAG: bifunctional diaminohydroxyphosphoribosylaminopyrimidine deaminase/5-amino-6-(5-phosphoribosylamino)uracil reductase RibD [Pirellulales bacterium]|nr:bifunctional diaminohydroxyphosphoribosylaminopyrimidine deaminase/5-amino-6-(5-phosphoribosylamino)uracil reductase RibD [Pirellulales bacterium]
MARALELAARGRGNVEPNPMVGCVLAREGAVVGEGWHRTFGGPHAEVEALHVAGSLAMGATAFVTLEPCCHHGKTPPCTDALIAAGVARVVCAVRDPFAKVGGQGIAALEAAGIVVEVGLMESEGRRLNAPYFKLVQTNRPWTIAKWAMTLDGKIATRTGDSQWISGDAARAIVHELRGRMDAIIVGRGTAKQDDPLLTARPPGARVATRIVVDDNASLSRESQLVRSVKDAPVLIAAAKDASAANIAELRAAGCEVVQYNRDPNTNVIAIDDLLADLGQRRMANVLVEGGGELLGSMFDAAAIDEIHVFVAPKLVGGKSATSPIGGMGVERIASAALVNLASRNVGNDIYLYGAIR